MYVNVTPFPWWCTTNFTWGLPCYERRYTLFTKRNATLICPFFLVPLALLWGGILEWGFCQLATRSIVEIHWPTSFPKRKATSESCVSFGEECIDAPVLSCKRLLDEFSMTALYCKTAVRLLWDLGVDTWLQEALTSKLSLSGNTYKTGCK